MTTTTAYAHRDGVRIAYSVQGSGPGLLLTHGFGSSSHMWEHNVDALAEAHTVVSWDMRGHGVSDYPTRQDLYEPSHVVEDMRFIMAECGFERFTPIGMSVGGYLSLLFTITHPEAVEKLVLVDTGPGFKDPQARARWNTFAEDDRAVKFETIGLDALDEERSEFRRSVHRDATGLARASRGYLTQYDGRVIESLRTIEVPTLVVVGVDDHLFLKSCHYIAAKMPNAQIREIPDAGHASNIDNADVFNAEVTAFLGQV